MCERSAGPSRLDTSVIVSERRLREVRVDPRLPRYRAGAPVAALGAVRFRGALQASPPMAAVIDSCGRYFGRGEAGRQRQIEHAQQLMQNGGSPQEIKPGGLQLNIFLEFNTYFVS